MNSTLLLNLTPSNGAARNEQLSVVVEAGPSCKGLLLSDGVSGDLCVETTMRSQTETFVRLSRPPDSPMQVELVIDSVQGCG